MGVLLNDWGGAEGRQQLEGLMTDDVLSSLEKSETRNTKDQMESGFARGQAEDTKKGTEGHWKKGVEKTKREVKRKHFVKHNPPNSEKRVRQVKQKVERKSSTNYLRKEKLQ